METRTPEEIEQSAERLVGNLKSVVKDGEELLKAGAEDLSEKGVAARQRLTAALDVARQTCGKLEERVKAGAHNADRLIHEHPYESIGLAFGVGVLLGVLLNRK
jgi:ElaB/YqjD/DUF883 family membrane-anchored ribosome-binding protein